MEPLNWGIISTAKIGVELVIPAMMQSPLCNIAAIASRDIAKAQAAADQLGIAKAYGSYEELLADPDIDIVYNPLPNDQHVPVSIQALECGKHVLCEKPIGLNADEVKALIEERDRTGKQIIEAFMVRHHPQWQRARDEVRKGTIGELRAVQYAFSFYNDDPHNIRNIPKHGGGTLYDIGVYPIVTSRYIFGTEPKRVMALAEWDPQFGTDRLVSAILDYGVGQASFTCSTQMTPYQRAHIFGTQKRIEIEIPFNAPNDRPTRLLIDDGAELDCSSAVEVRFDTTDQYGLQGEAFVRAIQDGTAPEHPLEDALNNMKVVDGLFLSARENRWVEVSDL